MVRLTRNEKQIYRLNSMPQMWPFDLTFPVTLTLDFQGQIWNLLHLSQKWFDCHKMYSTYIDWKASMTIKLDLVHDFESWGVRINRIVSGVNSDVGVPPTRLAMNTFLSAENRLSCRNRREMWLHISLLPPRNITLFALYLAEKTKTQLCQLYKTSQRHVRGMAGHN